MLARVSAEEAQAGEIEVVGDLFHRFGGIAKLVADLGSYGLIDELLGRVSGFLLDDMREIFRGDAQFPCEICHISHLALADSEQVEETFESSVGLAVLRGLGNILHASGNHVCDLIDDEFVKIVDDIAFEFRFLPSRIDLVELVEMSAHFYFLFCEMDHGMRA